MGKDYIEELLASMGLGGYSYSDIPSISSEDIASGLAGAYGIDPSMLPSSLFSTMPSSAVSQTYRTFYAPLMQTKTSNLLQKLIAGSEGKPARTVAGGFADTSATDVYGKSLKKEYQMGSTDVLTDIGQSIVSSEQSIIDWLNSMKETAQSIRYA